MEFQTGQAVVEVGVQDLGDPAEPVVQAGAVQVKLCRGPLGIAAEVEVGLQRAESMLAESPAWVSGASTESVIGRADGNAR